MSKFLAKRRKLSRIGLFGAQRAIVLLRAKIRRIRPPKHSVLQGTCPLLARKCYKAGEETPKGQIDPISRTYTTPFPKPPPPYPAHARGGGWLSCGLGCFGGGRGGGELWNPGLPVSKPNPEVPAALKKIRDSELLRRSVFTTPPIFTALWTRQNERKTVCNSQENGVPHNVRRDSKSLCDSKFATQSKFTTA